MSKGNILPPSSRSHSSLSVDLPIQGAGSKGCGGNRSDGVAMDLSSTFCISVFCSVAVEVLEDQNRSRCNYILERENQSLVIGSECRYGVQCGGIDLCEAGNTALLCLYA